MSKMILVSLVLLCFPFANLKAASRYTELLNYVQEAPDQGKTASCLYVASTGAMELIANKKYDEKFPRPYGKYDLAESFLIHAPQSDDLQDKTFWEKPILRFNKAGFGIHISDWPYVAWEDTDPSRAVWENRDWSILPKIELPKVETVKLFVEGENRWSTNVLTEKHVAAIKEALKKYRSPVMVNYNDNKFWHVILIVGYDDDVPGDCYQITRDECGEKKGAFFIRDSFGLPIEVRDYDWFRIKGNAAFVVKEVK